MDDLEALRRWMTARARWPALSPDADARRSALLEIGGEGLLVPEPPPAAGAPHGASALLAQEAAVVLERAGVLGELRDAPARAVVWEAGGALLGLPYALASIGLDAVCILSAAPERLLAAAVCLLGAFPGRRACVVGPSSSRWPFDHDLVLMPGGWPEGLQPPRLDLVSVGAQRNGEGPEEALAAAHSLRARFAHAPATGLRPALERGFWLQEAPLLPAALPWAAGPAPSPLAAEHLVGWRRSRPAP